MKVSLYESGPSDLYKDSSLDAGFEKPAIDQTEVAPTVVSTPSKRKEVDDSDVIVTGTRQGDPPAQNVLAKVYGDKSKVMRQPFGSMIRPKCVTILYCNLT